MILHPILNYIRQRLNRIKKGKGFSAYLKNYQYGKTLETLGYFNLPKKRYLRRPMETLLPC